MHDLSEHVFDYIKTIKELINSLSIFSFQMMSLSSTLGIDYKKKKKKMVRRHRGS